MFKLSKDLKNLRVLLMQLKGKGKGNLTLFLKWTMKQ